MDYLNKNRNKRWEETAKGIDFTHSGRKAWKTFNRLTGRKSDPKQCPITANSIAKQLLANGRFRGADKQQDLSVKRQCSMMGGAWGRRPSDHTFHHLRTLSDHKTTERWKSPGPRQHPTRVHDALW